MLGPNYKGIENLDDDSGILPRLAFFIFEEINPLHGICELVIEVSALEVYCDTV